MITRVTIDDSPEGRAETARLVNEIRTVERQAADPVVADREAIRANPDYGTHKLTIGEDGQARATTTRTTQITQDDLRPQTGSFLDTAASKAGHPLAPSEFTPETLVEYQGTTVELKTLERLGVVQRNGDGSYTDPNANAPATQPGQQPEQKAAEADNAPSPEMAEAEGLLNTLATNDGALAGDAINAVLDAAVSGDPMSLDNARLGEALGLNSLAAQGASAAVFSAYQTQADDAVRGAGVDDVAAFYEWARNENPDALREAVRQQIHVKNVGEWAKLARSYTGHVGAQFANLNLDHLLTADLPDGLTAAKSAKDEILLTHPSFGTVEAKEALRRGLVQGDA